MNLLERLRQTRRLFTNEITIKLFRYLAIATFVVLSFPILSRSSFVRGLFNLYLAAFFLWLGTYIYCRLETKTLVLVALLLLLFLPPLLILDKDILIIEDLSIYIYEILSLAIIQEVVSRYKRYKKR